jgi:hypothetical protein
MVDPMGTAGGAKENILDVATKGGPKFMERLEQLADASDRHEQTLAQLEIGQSAVAAFNQAQCKLAEAEHSRKLAEAERNQAAKTLADAKANSKAQAVIADQLVADANVRLRQAEKHMEHVEGRERAAAEATSKAERAIADATRLRDDLQGKADRLLTAMREIAQGQ